MTLRQKILLLGAVAVGAMLLALWLQYRSYTLQFQAVEAISRNVRAIGALSHVTHQLQKERGLTTIARAGANSPALAEQFHHTDAALGRLAGMGLNIISPGETLAQLRAMREDGASGQLAIRDGYTKLLQRLIDEMDRLIREPGMTFAKAEISAHTHLVGAKEYLGQIRATVGYWIEHRRDDSFVLNNLIRLKSLHDEALRKFGLEAAPGPRQTLATSFSGREVETTLNAVAQIAATGRLPQRLDVQAWWAMATAANDRLNFVEDYSLAAIERRAEGELAQLRNAMRLEVVITLALGLAALILAVSATSTLLRALDRALVCTELVATTRDFSRRIPVDSPDEIGRISRSINQLLDITERLLIEKDYLATTDPLTGINNRLLFAKVLADEAERKRRNKMPMALIMFDIDHFKRINDAYGHNVGDEVLKTLAHLVGGKVRASDFFARWGGEEFVLLLRDDDCEAAMAGAEKLRRRIASADFPVVGKVTCSFGVAAWEQDDTETSLVARADQALYAAKNGGRNRVNCGKGPVDSCPECPVCAK